MTSNVSMGGGTAVFYLQTGGARLAVLDCGRRALQVMTIAHGRKVREELSLDEVMQIADPKGTTWVRRDINP